MCEACERVSGPDREYQPIRLTCKTAELASAFLTILINLNTGLKTDGGVIEPYLDADGVTLVLPWAGHPKFVNAITELASMNHVAEVEAIREMGYGAMAQGMNAPVDDVREFGETMAEAMMKLMGTVGSTKPVDIDSLMETLDMEIEAMQHDPREKGN